MVDFLGLMLGGAMGALLRFLVNEWCAERQAQNFPYGTLTVNLVGCFLIGLLWIPLNKWGVPELWRMGILVGLLGAFTTFSTYSLQSVELAMHGKVMAALGNFAIHNVAGFALTGLGLWAGLKAWGGSI